MITLTSTAAVATSTRYIVTGLTSGSWYLVEVEMRNVNMTTVGLVLKFPYNDTNDAVGTSTASTTFQKFYLLAQADNTSVGVTIFGNAGAIGQTCEVRNISVKEIPGQPSRRPL